MIPMRIAKTRRARLVVAVVALLAAGGAAHALVATSSASYRANNGAIAPGGAQLSSANFGARAARAGSPAPRLTVSSVSAVQDWQNLEE
jgi:hypothetical protein